MSGYELFRRGKTEEAIDAYSEELVVARSPMILSNRALAFLTVKQYAAAARDAEAASELQFEQSGERGDGYVKQLAVALWLSGDRVAGRHIIEGAITGLERGSYQFTDRAGGVGSALLLWYMAVQTASNELLERSLAYMQSKVQAGLSRHWPGPIAEHILAQLSYTALMASAQSHPTLAMRRGCQAVFYAAILARTADDREQASRLLKMAVEYGEALPIELEYFLALSEFESAQAV